MLVPCSNVKGNAEQTRIAFVLPDAEHPYALETNLSITTTNNNVNVCTSCSSIIRYTTCKLHPALKCNHEEGTPACCLSTRRGLADHGYYVGRFSHIRCHLPRLRPRTLELPEWRSTRSNAASLALRIRMCLAGAGARRVQHDSKLSNLFCISTMKAQRASSS